MYKTKNFLSLVGVFLALSCGFQSQAADGWHLDRQDAQGKKKYKNNDGWVKWSSEDLKPQASRPSSESQLWIAHKHYILKDSWNLVDFSYNIVTPEGIQGVIGAKYSLRRPIEIHYFPEGSSYVDERRYAEALDLVLDKLSDFRLDFPSFEIHIDSPHATLLEILNTIHAEEGRSGHSSSSKILELYNRFISSNGDNSSEISANIRDDYFSGTPSVKGQEILRRSLKK